MQPERATPEDTDANASPDKVTTHYSLSEATAATLSCLCCLTNAPHSFDLCV